MLVPEIKYGVFKKELKNRFLGTVNIEGTDTVCYIPSSCRLSNFIDLSNRHVMLQPIKKKDARTTYSVYAVKHQRSYVLLNMSDSNRIIEESIHRRIFAFLGKRRSIFREKNIDGYKSDLYLEDTDTIIEVKSILSFDNTAHFPTVFSERAICQLKNIRKLLNSGHKVCYMFVSMYFGVKEICINEQQEEYCKLFRECIKSGMEVCAFSLGMKGSTPYVKTQISVSI